MTTRRKSKTPERQAAASSQRRGAQPASTRAKAAPPIAPDENDEGPVDMDEFRLELVRRIATFLNDWPRCDQPVCRRARRCAERDVPCMRRADRPQYTAEEKERALASLLRALKRRLAESDAEEQE